MIVNSGYSEGGASTRKNRLKTWLPMKFSPTADINRNLFQLRNRSSDLAINTSLGAAIISTFVLYVIGSGLKLSPKIDWKILGLSKTEAREWESKTKREWELYSSNIDVDYYRRNNFYDLQQIAYESSLIDGDSFVVFRRLRPTSRAEPYTLRLQLIEGNRISNPNDGSYVTGYESINPSNGNKIIDGVEIDHSGRLVAYWISSAVPNDPTNSEAVKWNRIKAFGDLTSSRNVLQITRDHRPNMTRGIPILSPVIENLKQIDRFISAELDSAIVRANYSIIFTQFTNPTQFDINNLKEEDKEPYDTSGFFLGPGTATSLPFGVDVKSLESIKTSVFPAFVEELLKHIGSAVGLPFEFLLHHFSASYSASRASIIQAWQNFRQQRECFIRDFCEPIYQNFLDEAIINGRIDAPKYFDDPLMRKAWQGSTWFGISIPSIDPLKEANAAAKRLELGLTTLEKESFDFTSSDYEENLEQRKFEQNLKGVDQNDR